jgi:hypothetical protein
MFWSMPQKKNAPNTACTRQVGFTPSKRVDSVLEQFPSNPAFFPLETGEPESFMTSNDFERFVEMNDGA